ncbi:aromatic amino acid ammonia-lyase [Kineosporia rhizophila]|uniref:HAL/PAL/TAL family ammonia-lyase n=1 Tax=Kineosporia rhizophila TaxID=84633 RepID=UPI001E30C69A|nr:aromatic amino acid ammonia-lyase [Kineosporia rhizophila]MCE0536201.1 aromatic amino acid ammonia-lyase [Kineosporia rhizophila]
MDAPETSTLQIDATAPADAVAERIVLDGYTLSPADVARVASRPGTFGLALSSDAAVRMKASVRVKEQMIDSGIPIYGVTTGFGDSSGRQVGAAKTAELQRNLLRFLRVGVGPVAAPEVIRATMLIRANCAARGNSAIREELVRLILDLLEHDVLPQIPERGSVGASGDLAPLSYLAAALTGEGQVRWNDFTTTAAEALRANGLQSLELQAKEGLALVNGTSFMAAFATLALTEATEIAWAAELCTAFATEVRGGSRDQFSAFPHLHKPHPGQITSAVGISDLLEGSALAVGDDDLMAAGLSGDQTYLELEQRIQEPYSIRCAPHVIGVLRDTMGWVEQWMEREINSSNDNPLFDAEAGRVHNSGNFYGGHVAHAAQALSTATASVADLLDRQLALLVDEKFNRDLTPNLIARVAPDHPAAGVHHGFKGAQIAASALTAEALHLATPAGSFSRSTEAHNQDKVSMGTIAARHARTVGQLVTEVTAIHLLALCQAADIVGPERLGRHTARAHAAVRAGIPTVEQDRPMDLEIQAVAEMLRTGALRAAVTGS